MMPVYLVESSSEFKRAIALDKLVVVDFFASWCGPCREIAPRFDHFATEFPNVGFYKVNVDSLPVAADWGVTAMPTFKFFRRAKLLDEVIGANVQDIKRKIQQHMTSAPTFSGTGRVLGSGAAPSKEPSPPLPKRPSTSSSAAAGTPTGATPTAAAGTQSSPYIWLLFVFIAVYWWLAQRNKHEIPTEF